MLVKIERVSNDKYKVAINLGNGYEYSVEATGVMILGKVPPFISDSKCKVTFVEARVVSVIEHDKGIGVVVQP